MSLAIVAAAILLLAILQLVEAWRARMGVRAVATLAAPPPPVWPRVSVVVPARDEALGLRGALASKLASGYPDLEVVVVDDRSTDDTGAVARGVAERDPRVQVTRVTELPRGWLGKVHAMAVGAENATGEWLLLSDADVHIAPGALERVVASAEREGIDFVAIMPRLDPAGFLLDACVSVLLRLSVVGFRLGSVNDDRSKVGAGVGAFNLVRRAALARTPGLGHLRMEIADDVALGAMLKASGARCRLYAGRGDVHVTFAERLGVLARNLEKGSHMFGFSLLAAIVAPLIFLAVELGVASAALARGGAVALLGGAQLAVMTVLHLTTARHFGLPLRSAFLWPLGVTVSTALLARAGVLGWWRQAIVWRGTRYTRAEVEAGRRWNLGRISLERGERPRPTDRSGSTEAGSTDRRRIDRLEYREGLELAASPPPTSRWWIDDASMRRACAGRAGRRGQSAPSGG